MAMSGGFTRRRRWAGAAEGALAAVVVAVLVGAVVYAGTRPGLRWRVDLNADEPYSLSEQTTRVLAELERPVTAISIMAPETQTVAIGLYEVQARAAEYVESLLEEYAIRSGGTVTVERLHPHADRLRVEELVRAERLARYNVVLLRCGERSRQVFLDELVTIDRGLADPERLRPAQLLELHGEGPLTSALLDVTAETRPRVGIVTGHGEPPMDDFDRGGGGLGLFVEALRGQGLDPRPLPLFRGGDVPEEVDVVCLIGPRSPLGAGEIAALAAHRERGGALLLALDPLADDGCDPLLERLGLSRERARLTIAEGVVDPQYRSVITVTRFLPHPITEPIARQQVFGRLFGVGGLAKVGTPPPATEITTLMLSDEAVFGDRPGADGTGDAVLGEDELAGPRSLAFALESPDAGRAVVVGSSSPFTNGLFGTTLGGPANIDFALNALNWLAEREDAVGSRPRLVYESRVDLMGAERARVSIYVILVMPAAGALLGLLVWFVRRR